MVQNGVYDLTRSRCEQLDISFLWMFNSIIIVIIVLISIPLHPFRILEQVRNGAEKSTPMFLTPEIMGKRRGGGVNHRGGGSRSSQARSGSPGRDRLLAATGEAEGRRG